MKRLESISNKTAYKKFLEMVDYQNGDVLAEMYVNKKEPEVNINNIFTIE